MRRVVQAELIRLTRRRTMIVGAAAAAVFAIVSTWTVFASARQSGVRSRSQGTTIARLASSAGGSESFAVGTSFAGFLVFVTFIAVIAAEFSSGTFRALSIRDPCRMRVLVGKVIGLLLVAAVMVALAELFAFVASLAFAPSKDIGTTTWFTVESLGHAVANYGTVLAGVAGWAIFGSTLAVIFRSAPIALGVGFAWAGPFENIVVDSWQAGYRWFPGQVLASLIRGGTVELGIGRAGLMAVAYTAVAAAVTLTLVSRRDIT
jgi:hypothetical protein